MGDVTTICDLTALIADEMIKRETEVIMAATRTQIREKSVWVVQAECSGETQSWTFDDKEVAEWFCDVAAEYYMARCPNCEIKDILGMDVTEDIPSAVVIVSCGFHDCDFAKRIVRTMRKDGRPLWVAQI